MRSVAELMRLDERVAIVTGGAGHLGLAAAEALAELGARVVIVDRDEAACAARATDVADRFGIGTLALATDLSRDDAGSAIVARTLAAFGRIDIVVNNAAFTGASGLPGYAVPFPQQSLEAWDAALRVNLTAPFLLVQAAREALSSSGRGAVINIGSIYGIVAPNMGLYAGTVMGNPAAYGASKAGIAHLTRYLATVLSPHVRVNCVSPGGIERGQPEAFQERYRALTPLGRMGREEDLKGAIAFLAGDAAAYVTGQELAVDGGWTTW